MLHLDITRAKEDHNFELHKLRNTNKWKFTTKKSKRSSKNPGMIDIYKGRIYKLIPLHYDMKFKQKGIPKRSTLLDWVRILLKD